MGHSLPQVLNAWGVFVYDLKSATRLVLKELYGLESSPSESIPNKPKKTRRNDEIRDRYKNGESIPQLAVAYGLSNARIHQILHRKRC